MYEPLFVYSNSGISEKPTYVSKAFQVSGLCVLDCANVIVPPCVGNKPGEF